MLFFFELSLTLLFFFELPLTPLFFSELSLTLTFVPSISSSEVEVLDTHLALAFLWYSLVLRDKFYLLLLLRAGTSLTTP
jgi:hypothetical protein